MAVSYTEAEAEAIYLSQIQELDRIVYNHNELSVGKSGQELLEIKRSQNKELLEATLKHKRALDFMAGVEPVPETHFSAAVLLPAGGLG